MTYSGRNDMCDNLCRRFPPVIFVQSSSAVSMVEHADSHELTMTKPVKHIFANKHRVWNKTFFRFIKRYRIFESIRIYIYRRSVVSKAVVTCCVMSSSSVCSEFKSLLLLILRLEGKTILCLAMDLTIK